MSFNFEWPQFSESFYEDAREMLATALNKGQKPPIIADRIEVKELNMGTIPPELEILEIGDLSTDRFRGIFRLTYSGDAYIVLQTKVQANPLNVPRPSLDILGSPRILFAAAPLVVPMTLRLSDLSLRAIVVLVVSRQKGITLVFKNDPLESVQVSSSFDGVESVAGFIQREIENQLREAFRSDLPSVIHRLSQKWLSGEVKSAGQGAEQLGPKARVGLAGGFEQNAKIETRTAYGAGLGGEGGVGGRGRGYTRRMHGAESEAGESVELASQADSTWSTWGGDRVGESEYSRGTYGRSPSLWRMRTPGSSPPTVSHDQLDSVPESIEHYDPTYGLRPDSIPHHAGFADYERVSKAGAGGRGLGDVLEVAEEDDLDDDPFFSPRQQHVGDGSFEFDMIGLHDLVDDGMQHPLPRTSFDSLDVEPDFGAGGYETIPAVGGGTVTRPRVFHTQSQMRMRTASTGSLSAHGSPSTATARSAGGGSAASTVGLGRSLSYGKLAPLDARLYGAPSLSGTSTPRFPFPKYPPPPAYSAAPSPSLIRNTSLPNLDRYASSSFGGLHRSTNSAQYSSATTSPDFGRSSLFRSQSNSAYSSPPSSVQSPSLSPQPTPPPVEPDEGVTLPFSRPSAVDLLSRSPSSVLNTSFLDEEHLPITLNPSGNDSCAHLATLTSSNQTLSPFTRDHEGVTARSSPHILGRLAPTAPLAKSGNRVALLPGGLAAGAGEAGGGSGATTPQPVKAVRKRIHRIGSAKAAAASPVPSPSLASTPMLTSASSSSATLLSPRTPAISRRSSSLSRLPSSPLRNGASGGDTLVASEYGSFGAAAAGLGAGGGAGLGGKKAPSELSDFFPTVGAREMLARMKLGGAMSPRR
ncbi:hypothetical protein JCM8097_009102 [Rhodosporidiobolus ruineniae]